MNFLFTCGGTAGHVNPAIAVAGMIREMLPQARMLFIGGGRELENRLVPQAGFEIKNIRVTGFSRGFSPADIKYNIGTLNNLRISDNEMKHILREFQPDAALGTGGYVCYPVLKRAASMGIPTAVHESNAVPGLTTKMLSSVVDKVMVAFPGMESMYSKPERVSFVGTPVRGEFSNMTKLEAKAKLGVGELVVSFWGSLGAEKMNMEMSDFIAIEAKNGAFHHIHATGGGEDGVKAIKELLDKKSVGKLPERIDIRPYIDDMPVVMKAADLVLCRAGASTIAELTSLGKAAIIVPSPNVTNNHQEKNAAQLSKAGAAVVIHEADCTGEMLFEQTSALMCDKERLKKMSQAMQGLGMPNALKNIAETVIGMAQSHSKDGAL